MFINVVTYTRNYGTNLIHSSLKVTGFGLILSAYGTIQKEKDQVEFCSLVPERKCIMKLFYSTQYSDFMRVKYW